MVYTFKQALHIAGKDFARGNHEVPEKCENHPHFLKYVGAGLILEALPVAAPQSEKLRSEKLLNKLVKRVDAKKTKEAAKVEPVEPPVPPVLPFSAASPASDETVETKSPEAPVEVPEKSKGGRPRKNPVG